jgi:hypothetical protein
VDVNTLTGNVTKVGDLVDAHHRSSSTSVEAEHFDPDFGGSVVHAMSGGGGAPVTMTHVLRRSKSKAHVVVRVDTACPAGKCAFTASALLVGVNNENRVSTFFST